MNERVKLVRQALGLTLDKFGAKIGLKKSALSRIETGYNSLTEQTLLAICREYNVDETWLRTGKGEMFIDEKKREEITQWVSETLSSSSKDFQRSFIKMLMRLTDEDWIKFENYVHEAYADYTAAREKKGSIEQAETDYINSRSSSAQKTTLSVSSTTADTGKPSAVGE